MNTKYILEKISLEGQMRDLLAKTTAELVACTYNGEETTLAVALTSIFQSIASLHTAEGVDGKISAAIDALIGGAPETYDTFKEIADYITEHKDAADALAAAIGQKAAAADLVAAVERITALEGKKVAESDLNAELAEKVNAAAEGNHSHSNKAVLDSITAEQVSAWDGLRGVRYGTEPPADMEDGELFVRIVSE